MKHKLRLSLGGMLIGSSVISPAAVSDWQTAAASQPNLMHHYTFDGSTDQERMNDKKGVAHLAPRLFGSGTIDQLELGVPGFDESSASARTHRGPGSDNTEGAYLHTPSVTLGRTVSYEVLFSPVDSEISGGSWNLGYILSTRVGNERGYFLTQGGPLPSSGLRIASTIGNSHSDPNTNTVLESFTVGNWYYVAGSYTVGAGNVTWTNYVADLTAGETTLTAIGPFTNVGGTYPLVSSELGVGGRWDRQEAFSGFIDEVMFYDEALPQSVFQKHLGLLTDARIDFAVEADGEDLVLTWGSTAGKRYNVRSSTDLSGAPTTWPVYGGLENLEATPDLNILSLTRPVDPERYFVVEEFQPPPVVLYFTDFEGGAVGWTTLVNDENANTAWELGSPAGTTGPLAGAAESVNAWSTNLGDYGPDSDISLRSPAIDLSGIAEAELSFEAFRDADGFGDIAVVRFLRASDLSQLGEEAPIDMEVFDNDWTTIRFPVAPEAIGETVLIEWNFISDDTPDSFSGLSIDDVRVSD
ncbi:MAG: LamG domain-containing protein [Roseibacillus sp.]|nr:LamG domain-containing protein [Roseibacillus sp.]